MDIMQVAAISIAANIALHFQPAFSWVMDPKNRTKVKTILWIGAVFLLLILTIIFILMSYFFTASYKFGIAAATVLWAILFGIFILFILPSKLVTTVFGGFLGIGASEWSTADGLITKADESITKIAHQVSSMVGGQTHGWTILSRA
jgi:hypothetical protein